MKLNESNLADPLLLTGCALAGPPWGSGSGGPFGGQDLISTTTFPDDTLILPGTPNSGVNTNLSCKGSSPNGPTGVELDALLIVHSSDNYAELKPLPPFEYAATPVAQLTLQNDPHLPQMGSTANSPPNHNHSNNHSSSNNHNNAPNNLRNGASGGSTGGSSIQSSPNANSFSSSSVGGSPSSIFDPVSSSTSVPAHIKSELAEYLMNSDIDDIAALIGNAIADSTVPNLGIELDPNGVTSSTIDPWTELDAWIESACQQPGQVGPNGGGSGSGGQNGHGQNGRGQNSGILLDQDSTIHTSAADQSFLDSNTSTLQTLLEADSYSTSANNALFHHQDIKHQEFHPTSILQSRLQQPISGHLLRITPNTSPSQLPESTTQYGLKVDPYTLDPGSPTYIDPITGEMTQRPHTTHVSPPAVVTSTMMNGSGNGNSKYRNKYKLSNKNNPSNGNFHHHSSPDGNNFISPYGSSSPYDPSHNGIGNGNQVSYATSSHIGPPSWSHNQPHHWRKEQSKLGIKTKRKSSKLPSSSGVGSPLDPCGKEKPIHRCGICNRGFLNKSNIKVHLRTHTGEKPFKCDVCGKAFRQKAHLLKHVQIHKRITRD